MKSLPSFLKTLLFILTVSIIFAPFIANKITKLRESNIFLSQSEQSDFNNLINDPLLKKPLNDYQLKNANDFLCEIQKDGKISIFETKLLDRQLKNNFAY